MLRATGHARLVTVKSNCNCSLGLGLWQYGNGAQSQSVICLTLRPIFTRGSGLALTRALRARRARPPEVAALQPRAQRA